ncbi:uncharacterized protein TNCV_1945561 [Trichonephila clavipes]|nr:uncharacterized protein TNCV_1945561 [Trichonephila clavipes]
MKVGVCEGRVKTVTMGAQRVINPDNIGHGSIELKEDKGVANPEGLICENSCEEKYTLGTLMGCEKQLTMNRESFRNHTIAKIAGQSNRTLPVVWLGRVNRYPYPRIKCMKYRNLNQVTRAEIYFFKKGKFGRKDQRDIVGDCTGFVEVVFSSFTTDELSEAHHMRYASWHVHY